MYYIHQRAKESLQKYGAQPFKASAIYFFLTLPGNITSFEVSSYHLPDLSGKQSQVDQ